MGCSSNETDKMNKVQPVTWDLLIQSRKRHSTEKGIQFWEKFNPTAEYLGSLKFGSDVAPKIPFMNRFAQTEIFRYRGLAYFAMLSSVLFFLSYLIYHMLSDEFSFWPILIFSLGGLCEFSCCLFGYVASDRMRFLLFKANISPADIVESLVHRKRLSVPNKEMEFALKRVMRKLEEYILDKVDEKDGMLTLLATQWLFLQLPLSEQTQYLPTKSDDDFIVISGKIENVVCAPGHISISYIIGSLHDNGYPDESSMEHTGVIHMKGDINRQKVINEIVEQSKIDEDLLTRTAWTKSDVDRTYRVRHGLSKGQASPWTLTDEEEESGRIRVFLPLVASSEHCQREETLIELANLVRKTIEDTDCHICYSTTSSKVFCPHCSRCVVCIGCAAELQRASSKFPLECPSCRGAWSTILTPSSKSAMPAITTTILKSFVRHAESLNLCTVEDEQKTFKLNKAQLKC